MDDPRFSPLPPHHTEAEETVLGAILIDPEAIGALSGQLEATDFYHPRHRDIYLAMEALHAKRVPPDFLLVCEELERREVFEAVGGVGYLSKLLTVVPTSIHAPYYAEIVTRLATQRRLIQVANQIATLGYAPTDHLDQTLSEADALLATVTRRGGTTGWKALGAEAVGYLEEVQSDDAYREDGSRLGLTRTGFHDLDHLLGGFYPGNLIVLAARPATGKTALMLNLTRDVAVRQRGNVGLFTLEMSAREIAGRLLSSDAQIDGARLREGRLSQLDLGKLGVALETLQAAPLWLDDTSSLSLRELQTRARRLHSEHPLSLLAVDYLQLVHAPGQNRVQVVGEISRTLKALAGDLQCPVLALSQLSRAVESRSPHIPILSDLRDSGDVEQDCDVALMLYREDMYDHESERKGITEVHVAKHRNGPTGVVNLLFLERFARFVDLTQGRN